MFENFIRRTFHYGLNFVFWNWVKIHAEERNESVSDYLRKYSSTNVVIVDADDKCMEYQNAFETYWVYDSDAEAIKSATTSKMKDYRIISEYDFLRCNGFKPNKIFHSKFLRKLLHI